jgi:hypothetical protein
MANPTNLPHWSLGVGKLTQGQSDFETISYSFAYTYTLELKVLKKWSLSGKGENISGSGSDLLKLLPQIFVK